MASLILGLSGIAHAGGGGDGTLYTVRGETFCNRAAGTEIRGLEHTPAVAWEHTNTVNIVQDVDANGNQRFRWTPGTLGQPGSVIRGFAEFVGEGQYRLVKFFRNDNGKIARQVTNTGNLPYVLLILCVSPTPSTTTSIVHTTTTASTTTSSTPPTTAP